MYNFFTFFIFPFVYGDNFGGFQYLRKVSTIKTDVSILVKEISKSSLSHLKILVGVLFAFEAFYDLVIRCNFNFTKVLKNESSISYCNSYILY